MAGRDKIGWPQAWHGREMAGSGRWVIELTEAEIAELDAAVRAAAHLPWNAIGRDTFPLEGLAGRLDAVRDELEDGCGMVKLRRVPVERYADDDLKRLWYGLGCHLGSPVFQNCRGELMRAIRDEGAEVGRRYGAVETGGGTFLSSYARTLTSGGLRFHTDRCDVVGLFCVRQAASGGTSMLCSSAAVHDAILERRPDLLEVYAPYHRSRFGEEPGGERVTYPLPIFGLRDGKLTSHYSLTYIESAQLMEGVPELGPAQREAIDLLMRTAEELSFEMTLEPGDIQLLNNHVIYHGRTPFTDDAAAGQSRLLYRLWLAVPNSRGLPADHAVLWRDVAPGALRGGIGQEPVA